MTAKQRAVIIPEDQSEEGIDGMERNKDSEKRKALRQGRKTPRESRQGIQDQSMTMEKSWVIMKDRTDKEHEE